MIEQVYKRSKKIILSLCMILTIQEAYAARLEVENYLNSLNSEIESYSLKLKYEPSSYQTLLLLSKSWYEKSGYTGNIYDTKKSIELSSSGISALTEQKESSSLLIDFYLLRARQQMRIHLFDLASEDVKRAKSLGAPLSKMEELLMDIEWNKGHYDTPIKKARKKIKQELTVNRLIHVAGFDFGLGNYAEAIKQYEAAIEINKMTSVLNPVQKSWVYVQLGINYTKLNHYENAEKAFQEALQISPSYIMALEHYAEMLALAGKTSEAISMYEKVVKMSDDPEFMGQLGKLYLVSGKEKEGQALISQAREKFKTLLKEFPAAMYWHAASFFLDVDQDVNTALMLLEKNNKLRPTSESYLALATAQLKANDREQAKISMTKVLQMPPLNLDICEKAKEVLSAHHTLYKKRCSKKS